MQVPPNSDLTLGMVCLDKATPGHSVWQMTADERFANPAGITQGGFISAFCDSAMGAAAVTYVRGRKVFAANAEMKISFLARVPIGAILICTADVVSGGPKVAFVEASVEVAAAPESTPDPEHPVQRLVARATSTYLFKEREVPARS